MPLLRCIFYGYEQHDESFTYEISLFEFGDASGDH